MPTAEPSPHSPFRRALPALAAVTVVAALVALPWWRNHTFLRDFYDYGLVIAASFRMSLGEMPYVDFTTPIQTLHFLQARGAERLFGPHYLSLTYPNLILILLAFLVMTGILRRALGLGVAILVAAAVVTASAGQHTIVWHNAMGVIWTALVVWLTARSRPASEPGATGRLLCVGAFLWLGGMTKINYQITALAFAGLFALRDGWVGAWTWRRVILTLAAYGLFGIVAPLATEMLYTGAGPARWLQNVVVIPESRLELVKAMGEAGFYFKTPHDYYRPLHMPFIGAWGVAVLLAMAILSALRLRRVGAPCRAWVLLAAMVVGAWICAGVLQATNFDIAYVAGAAWLALSAGLALALLPESDGRVGRAGRAGLAVAAVTLLGPAWQAAWNGTRALWYSSEVGRAEMVSTDDLPERYEYFRGMRITPALHESLERLNQLQNELNGRGQASGEFYFLNGTEFLLRAFPGKRFAGLPLWLHEGTTYGEKGARLIQQKLASADIRGVVSFGGWNRWYHGMEWYLDARYQYERVGPVLHVYRERGDPRRNWRDPTSFSSRTASSAYVPDITEGGGPFTLCRASAGPDYLGTPRTGRLIFRRPLASVSAELVARRAAAAGQSPLDMVWRVVTTEPDGTDTVLRDVRLILAPDEPERLVPINVDTGGKPAALELYLPPDQRIEAGFRRLHTEYAAAPAGDLPDVLGEKQPAQPNPDTWAKALFADESLRHTPCLGFGFGTSPNETDRGPELFVHTPGVVWFKLDAGYRHLAGEFGLGSATWTNRDALNGVRAQVVYYRPGHLEVLVDRELRPREREADRAAQSFEVEVPGQEGWVALVFTALDSPRNSYGHSAWRKIRAW